jgi:hypothetical protein
MTSQQATAEVFMTAFRALPHKEQNTFLTAMVKDARLREDIIDLAIATTRSREKRTSFHAFLKSLQKSKHK